MSTPVTADQVLDALRAIEDPDLHRDIVSLGFVKDLRIEGNAVSFTIELTTPACPVKERFESEARRLVGALPGVGEVSVALTAQVPTPAGPPPDLLPDVRYVIAVASGKGGVGKSTVATNLATALAATGARTGLLDADVYGPSIPIMLGVKSERPQVRNGKLAPLERHGVGLMSLGFIAGEDTPVIWRGPMVTKLLRQFLTDVDWGTLDYLVIDLPPGTGDAQLTLAQAARLDGAVIVTTPQDVALEDVKRGVGMFRKVDVPVLGVVENMSYFVCPDCGSRHAIFAEGGGRGAAERFGVPFLGEIPLHPAVREAGDAGTPIVVAAPDSPQAAGFRELAGEVARQLATRSFSTPSPA